MLKLLFSSAADRPKYGLTAVIIYLLSQLFGNFHLVSPTLTLKRLNYSFVAYPACHLGVHLANTGNVPISNLKKKKVQVYTFKVLKPSALNKKKEIESAPATAQTTTT